MCCSSEAAAARSADLFAREADLALVVLDALGIVAMSLLGERPGARAHFRRRLWPAARA
jgi:hypothetical protein